MQATPDNEDTTHPSQYNFKVPIQVNGDAFVNAELDSDSHISLISDKYYEKLLNLGPIESLNEAPLEFKLLSCGQCGGICFYFLAAASHSIPSFEY